MYRSRGFHINLKFIGTVSEISEPYRTGCIWSLFEYRALSVLYRGVNITIFMYLLNVYRCSCCVVLVLWCCVVLCGVVSCYVVLCRVMWCCVVVVWCCVVVVWCCVVLCL